MYAWTCNTRQGITFGLKSPGGTLKILSRVRTVLEVCYLHLMKRNLKTMFSGTSPTGMINRLDCHFDSSLVFTLVLWKRRINNTVPAIQKNLTNTAEWINEAEVI